MKNSYATQLAIKQKIRDKENVESGMQFAFALVVVALNGKFGFGRQRILELEAEVNRLYREEFLEDVEVATAGLMRRMEQIKMGGKKSIEQQ